MAPHKPGTDTDRTHDKPPQDDARERSPADTGGAPAAEEDIGTEGAGTEPRDTVDAPRQRGS